MPKEAGGPFHTTVSAFWFVQELPWVDGNPQVRLVELPNPWAKNPIEWQDERASRVLVKKTDDRVEFIPPESKKSFLIE